MTYNSIYVYTKTYLACFWLSIFSQELFVPHVATSSPPRLPYKSSCHACHGCQTLNIMYSWDWHNPPEQVHSKKRKVSSCNHYFSEVISYLLANLTSTNLQVPCHTWQQKQCPNVIYWTWMNMGKFHGCLWMRAGIVSQKKPWHMCKEDIHLPSLIRLTCHFLSTRPGIINLWS